MLVKILGFSDGIQAADTENSSILVRTDTTSILIDCSGSPCTALLNAGLEPNDLDAVFLTHAHVDHIYAFPSLIHNLWLRKRTRPIVVFGNGATIEKAKGLMHFYLMDIKKDMVPIEWHTELDRVGDIDVSIFPLFHRPLVPTSGFTFENGGRKFSYFPDSVVEYPLPEKAFGSDLVIHETEGTHDMEEALNRAGHSSAKTVAESIVALRAEKLMIFHFPGDGEKRKAIFDEAKSVFPNTVMPERGLEITV